MYNEYINLFLSSSLRLVKGKVVIGQGSSRLAVFSRNEGMYPIQTYCICTHIREHICLILYYIILYIYALYYIIYFIIRLNIADVLNSKFTVGYIIIYSTALHSVGKLYLYHHPICFRTMAVHFFVGVNPIRNFPHTFYHLSLLQIM